MSMRTIPAQLFGLAVLLTALFGLPQAVQAHAGHAHAIHTHAHAHAVDTYTQAQSADASAPADRSADLTIEQSLTAPSQSAPGHMHDTPCDRGCCAQASCAGCFSLMAPIPPLVTPPSLSNAITFAANRLPPGIDGSSLRRPPKTFA
jgi:hypothetical protein